ncbi:hypothetical protein RRSWK_03556 [Rhodopirellula sp. SWK7]|nr:hypothetical protein RRSWK_03556 [Rhodopirellula sp. SWK7]
MIESVATKDVAAEMTLQFTNMKYHKQSSHPRNEKTPTEMAGVFLLSQSNRND